MRGTTPKITFEIPLNASMIAKAKISFKRNGTILLTRYTQDCNIRDGEVSTTLTREETLLLPDNGYVKTQLEIETPAGQCLKTAVYTIYSSELLSPEVLK